MPLVSIIVTGRNEIPTIDGCIKSLLEQTYPNFEIIYVDGRSTDGTYDKTVELRNSCKEDFINCKGFLTFSVDDADSPAKGRNFGVKVANGSIIAFIDADCVAEKYWLINLINRVPKDAGIIGGPNLPKHVCNTPVTEAIDRVIGTYLGSGGSPQFLKIKKLSEVYAVPSCNMCISRSLFEEVGGFDEKLTYNEDSDLCKRILARGKKIVYNPEAKVGHYNGMDSYSDFARLISKYGVERGKNVLSNPGLLTRFNGFSIATFIILTSFLAISFFIGEALIILVSLVGIFLLVFVIVSMKLASKNESKRVLSSLYRLGIFLTIYIVYNIGFMSGYLSSCFKISANSHRKPLP
jgi:GT2 family glycosyltransferase